MKNEYCPNGNYWINISGWGDNKDYMFCDCNKCKGAVYEMRPINITKKVDNDKIQGFKNRKKCEEIRKKINIKNMDEVEKVLNI